MSVLHDEYHDMPCFNTSREYLDAAAIASPSQSAPAPRRQYFQRAHIPIIARHYTRRAAEAARICQPRR